MGDLGSLSASIETLKSDIAQNLMVSTVMRELSLSNVSGHWKLLSEYSREPVLKKKDSWKYFRRLKY